MSLAIVDVLVIAVRAIIEDLGMVVVGPKSHVLVKMLILTRGGICTLPELQN